MAISSTTPKASNPKASKKFNQKCDYQQRKKNDFQKKQRRVPISDKKKLWGEKNKERTIQLRGNRNWKEQETTLYSRVTLRKGKQLYDTFDTKYDHDLQFMGTEEYRELQLSQYWIYIDYYDYYDELDDTYRMETIRQQERDEEQQQRWDEEKRQRKKQKKIVQRLELEKLDKLGDERCVGRCTTCNQLCSSSNSSDTITQTQSLSFDYDYY